MSPTLIEAIAPPTGWRLDLRMIEVEHVPDHWVGRDAVVETGTVWVTFGEDPNDYIYRSGDAFTVREGTVVQAMTRSTLRIA